MKRTTILLVLLALFLLAGSALAMHSANYWLDWFTPATGGGGGPASSTNYRVNFTVGQTANGLSTSTGYRAGLGYWYGIADYKIYLPLMLKNYSS
ncbi:MAG: hypothetical protein CVU38_03945 [Chloroflexi bacterium HGW-Chloroflexi-1]|nr:MAG: hypothetical protein CVU38_03945 [Chloroflexi bacterium HGW-Chloroflexi-1]